MFMQRVHDLHFGDSPLSPNSYFSETASFSEAQVCQFG